MQTTWFVEQAAFEDARHDGVNEKVSELCKLRQNVDKERFEKQAALCFGMVKELMALLPQEELVAKAAEFKEQLYASGLVDSEIDAHYQRCWEIVCKNFGTAFESLIHGRTEK